jgi:hypothetical protein
MNNWMAVKAFLNEVPDSRLEDIIVEMDNDWFPAEIRISGSDHPLGEDKIIVFVP